MHLLHLWASSQTEMTDFPGFLHTTTRETPILSGGASPYNVYVIKGLTPPPLPEVPRLISQGVIPGSIPGHISTFFVSHLQMVILSY